MAALTALEREHPVRVAAPAEPVLLAGPRTGEVVAAVRECLSNVAKHVGPDAPAWVLVEAFDDRVEISVRDEGGGIPAGRLDEAAAAGRLGVAQSIRGRIADLGGTATLTTGAFGTEWELVIPRRAERVVLGSTRDDPRHHPFLDPESERDPVRRFRGGWEER